MNFDVFTIAAVVDELNATLTGGKIQNCLEIGNDALGFEVYSGHQRHYLLISADAQTARLHLADDKLRRGVENPSPLGLLLRRHIENARVGAVTQPPYERIVEIAISSVEGAFTLIVEPMERRSNILLVRDGIVLECMRRVGPHENRVRVSLPGQPYVPPPPQASKRPPDSLYAGQLAEWLAADGGRPAWRVLTETLLGFSPLLARETIYRAAGQFDAKAGRVDPADLLSVIHEMWGVFQARRWQPGVTGAGEAITSYAAYEI